MPDFFQFALWTTCDHLTQFTQKEGESVYCNLTGLTYDVACSRSTEPFVVRTEGSEVTKST